MKKILGINVDHIATLRNARNENYPNLIDLTNIIINAGADQITAHLREDRRHIKDKDIIDLKNNITVPLNMEMATTKEMLNIALQIKPYSVCLVPEKRKEITTEGGLNLTKYYNHLCEYIKPLQNNGIKVIAFIDPNINHLEKALELKVDGIEINTGKYSSVTDIILQKKELLKINNIAQISYKNSLRVQAGHGLNLANIIEILKISEIVEFNIGHFIVSYALQVGLKESVKQMKNFIINSTNYKII